MQIKNFIRTLQFGRPYIKNIILLSLTSLLSMGIGLIYLFILKNIVNTFFSKDFSHVRATILLSALLYIVRSVLSFFSSHLSLHTSEIISCDIKKTLFGHILKLPINFFKAESEGALMSRTINDTAKMQWLITGASISILGQPIKLAVLFSIAFWMNINLSFTLVCFLPLSYIAIKLTSGALRVSNEKLIDLYENLYSFLEQRFYGIEVIKTSTTEKKETAIFENLNKDCLDAELKQYRSIAILMPIQQSLMGICILFILWIGTHEVSSNNFSPGSFAAFGAIAFSIYALLNKIGRTYNRIEISLQSCARVFNILDQTPEPAGKNIFPCRIENIIISHLFFSYSKDVPVLKNISFEINSGETVLLKGSSGCGKTTLLRLLMGFYTPTSGEILYNNVPISKYNIYSLRKKINMVPQETILFNDNLINNITYGSFVKDKYLLQEALSLSFCHDFIKGLENGLLTKIGDRGVKLSSGQKQRIAIARAILRGGSILLLDEATSSIDEDTEKKILTSLKASGIFQTIIIISHRSSIEKFAKKVYSLDSGKICIVNK